MTNLLRNSVIPVSLRTGEVKRVSLPALLSLLSADGECVRIEGLRAHQRPVFDSFIVQIAAAALFRAGYAECPPPDFDWTDAIISLGEEECWDLVNPDDRPAFLQPPVIGEWSPSRRDSPGDISRLVLSKNHSAKFGLGDASDPWAWCVALLEFQTLSGYMGSGNYGISRQNSGTGTRVFAALEPAGGYDAWFRRDVAAVIALREETLETVPFFKPHDGVVLVWSLPWDGRKTLDFSELDPWYVDCARRARLQRNGDGWIALTSTSAAPRIDSESLRGVTGDPWAPIVTDKEGRKPLGLSSAGFTARQVIDILLGENGASMSPVQRLSTEDRAHGGAFVFRGIAAGQGKTSGYHERIIPVSRVVVGLLSSSAGRSDMGRIAREMLELSRDCSMKALRPALNALNARSENMREGFTQRFADKFRGEADLQFFEFLFDRLENPSSEGVWERHLAILARKTLVEATENMPHRTDSLKSEIEAENRLFRGLRTIFPDGTKVREKSTELTDV